MGAEALAIAVRAHRDLAAAVHDVGDGLRGEAEGPLAGEPKLSPVDGSSIAAWGVK